MAVKPLFAALLLATVALPAAAASPVVASAAAADPAAALATLIDEAWAYDLSQSPTFATSLGVRDYDDRIGDPSLAAMDKQAAQAARFLARLNAIPLDRLSAADRTNALILKWQLEASVEGNRYGQREMLFTTYSGWHQNFAGMADNLPFKNEADYRSYLTRMAEYPAYNDAALAVSDRAIADGYVLPCAVLGNYEASISGVIQPDPTKSRYYAPFTKPRPIDMTVAQWSAMQDEARAIIADRINPAYAKHAAWFRDKYLPACAKAVGISAQPGGAAYYKFQIKQMTTTDLTAEQIHAIGLKEVARIRAEMESVAKTAGYASRETFIEELRTDPKYYARTPQELMAAAALEAKKHDGLMPQYFGRLPRLPYGVKQIPAETAEGTTTAYYSPGSPEIGIAGNYYVNTSKLDQRPLYELPALTAHEAVPGHHNQIALNQELDLPDFRKYGANFTAFVEGWGLYSERLGIEMGIYDTPAKDMGRLSYEMWRACRLVVDTGIHAKGWSKARAVAYMKDNTALSDANIDAEVNRYISWPGQALAYKLGELKIRELRARAEQALGPRFDLRAFHDAVLGQGAVPLAVLEVQIDEWIAAEKGKTPTGA